MQQKSALLAAMAKGNGGGGGSGGGGSSGGGGGGGGGGRSGGGGGSSNKCRDRGTKAICADCNKLVVHAASDCYTLPANKDNILPGISPPNQTDRDRGPSIVLISMIG
jgi:hypothetical protein